MNRPRSRIARRPCYGKRYSLVRIHPGRSGHTWLMQGFAGFEHFFRGVAEILAAGAAAARQGDDLAERYGCSPAILRACLIDNGTCPKVPPSSKSRSPVVNRFSVPTAHCSAATSAADGDSHPPRGCTG